MKREYKELRLVLDAGDIQIIERLADVDCKDVKCENCDLSHCNNTRCLRSDCRRVLSNYKTRKQEREDENVH